VSYFDLTHGELKVARRGGQTWSTHVVASGKGPRAEAGRYAKLLLEDGKPLIAFLTIEKGEAGRARSKVTLARGKVAAPGSAADWKLEDVHVDENGPCRAGWCEGTEVCAPSANLGCSTIVKGCAAECGDGKACVMIGDKPGCADTLRDDPVSGYPRTGGAYVSAALGPNGIGIVMYDRLAGNLVGISNETGAWKETVLDARRDTKSTALPNDMGVGASLVIDDAGTWHVSYATGFIESLAYLRVEGGLGAAEPVITRTFVDDGTTLDGKPFADGKHRVGDDSRLTVGKDGAITIVYQDASAGTLRVATRPKDPAGAWALRAIAAPGRFGGFFPSIVGKRAAHWWRSSDAASKTMTGDVAFVDLDL
jgi:hypothetical protein